MSWQATTYVIEHSRMKGGALLTLIVLANHASGDEAIAWPTQETIARETRMSDRQIRRILDGLIASGEVEELARGRRGLRRWRITGVPVVESGHNVRPRHPPERTSATSRADISDTRPDIAMSTEPSKEESIEPSIPISIEIGRARFEEARRRYTG